MKNKAAIAFSFLIIVAAFLASARAYEKADVCQKYDKTDYKCDRTERFFIALTAGALFPIYWATLYWEDE